MAKKVTRVESEGGSAPASGGEEWKPTADANSRATKLRVVAILLWLAAIGIEVGLIVGLLLAGDGEGFSNTRMALLIGGVVVMAALAIPGNLLWKKANRLDPAHRSDTVRFFIQNQLGSIIAVIAFAPLVVLVLLDKDMSKGQKALAGSIAGVLGAIVFATGVETDPASVEQYTEEQDAVEQAMGRDYVYWAESSEVFHLCSEVSDLNRDVTKEIFEGTVAQAHEAGASRLTKKIDLEKKQCAAAGHDVPGITDEQPGDDEPTTESAPTE